MLKTENRTYYQVKKGQSLRQIAEYFSVAECLLVKINGLKEPPYPGRLLIIPQERGNAYFAREGDTKALLCGSEDNYLKKNGTDAFYIGMRVII